MKRVKKTKKIVYWLPRVLAILFIAFFSVFALDVFSEKQWPLALFMHLIPSFVLIILTVIAWKKEKLGGWLFITSGLIIAFFFHSPTIALPAFVIGISFITLKSV